MSDASSPVILIVDDDAFVRAVLLDALKEEGYSLLEARDGEEAVARVKADKPAVVLLDLFMPKKSGLEALAEIRVAAPTEITANTRISPIVAQNL